MVDSLAKKGYESSRMYGTGAAAFPRGNSKLGSNDDSIEVTGEGKKTKLQQEEGCPWVLPRSNCKKVTSEDDSKLRIDRRSKDKTSGKLDKLRGPLPDESVKFFTSKNANEKRGDEQKNNGEANQGMDAEEKSFSASEQVVFITDKLPPTDGNTVSQRSKNLRMKICELIGNIFSPDRDQTSSPPADEDDASLHPKPSFDEAKGASVQPRNNSDIIVSDSENPGCSKRRPVKRLKTGKRAQKNDPLKRLEGGHLNVRKGKLKESNAYLFEEGCEVVARQSYAPKKSSSILKQRNRNPATTTESKETTTKSKETERKFTCAGQMQNFISFRGK